MRSKRRMFSSDEDEYIRSNWEKISGAEMGRMLGRHENSIRVRMKKLGLYLSDELRLKYKMSGMTPGWNKGVKGYLSIKQQERGKVRDNVYDIGSVRVVRIADKEYKQIKVTSGKWELLHRVEWEKVNGELPKDYLLRCVDGNTLNTDASNWLALSKRENRRINGAGETLPDRYVAYLMSKDEGMRKEIEGYPELIELKRQSILLNREINK